MEPGLEVIERHPITSEEQWLNLRRPYLTSTAVPALFGLDPRRTPLHIFLEKNGVQFPQPDRENPVLRRGRWLEPAVAAAVSERRPEWALEPARAFYCDPDLKLGATPDFLINGDPRGVGILEAKTVSTSVFKGDWSDGAEVPLRHLLQTSTAMMLVDAAWAAIAVLLVDAYRMDIVITEFDRRPDVEARIKDAVSRFWDDVAHNREPRPNFARDGEAIKAMTASATEGKVFDATGLNSLPVLLAERAMLKADIKAAESRCDEIENEVRYLMADAATISNLPGWRVTFKAVDYKAYTVRARTTRVLRITDQRPTEEWPDDDTDDETTAAA